MNARGAALVAAVILLSACGGSSSSGPRGGVAGVGGDDAAQSERVGEAQLLRRDVERAIADEKDALAALDRELAALDEVDDPDEAAALRRVAVAADRVARAGHVAQLEACLDESAACPPSLSPEPSPPAGWAAADDELTGPYGVSAERWPEEAARLERDACACRSADCVAWVSAELERWEDALPARAQGEDGPSAHVTAARGCLWRRLGKR